VQAAGGARLIEAPAPPGPSHRAGSLQWAGLLAVAAAVVVADQVTKRLIEAEVGLFSTHEVVPFVSITHVRNTGIAFGIFPGRLEIVSLLTAVAVGWILLHFARAGSRHALFPTALGLLVGGSVSNLIDRVRQGYVTDFIDVGPWPTFNLADTFIVAGVAMLLVGLARLDRHPTDAEPAS
jgi:signal peptidase II